MNDFACVKVYSSTNPDVLVLIIQFYGQIMNPHLHMTDGKQGRLG
jgi:hypothetical protein